MRGREETGNGNLPVLGKLDNDSFLICVFRSFLPGPFFILKEN